MGNEHAPACLCARMSEEKSVQEGWERARVCVLKILKEILVALGQLHGRPIVVLRIAVEVAGVVWRPESGHVWRLVAAAEDAEPVESAEPLVTLDVLGAVAKAAKTGGAVRLQQFANQILGHRIERTRKLKFAG